MNFYKLAKGNYRIDDDKYYAEICQRTQGGKWYRVIKGIGLEYPATYYNGYQTLKAAKAGTEEMLNALRYEGE